jgi:hypothetical protein
VEVELSDCDKLTDDAFAALSDANGCPVLERLALDQCESLVRCLPPPRDIEETR